MSEKFYSILTEIGKAKVANSALLNKKLVLTTMKIGDGNGSYYNPSENQTDIVKQVYSGSISSIEIDEKNPNWVIAIGIIPGSIGGFYIREVGLFDDEGDLIAIGKYPETYKPSLEDGATNDLRIRTIFEVSNVESVTLKINPSIIFATKDDINNLQKQINENRASLEENTKDISQLSNPNILINDDFKVNQRNQTIYSEHGKYTVDRWSIFKEDSSVNTSTLEVVEDGIKLNVKESGIYCKQPIELEYVNKLKGNNLTASLYIKGENLEEGDFYIQLIGSDEQNNLIQKVKTINYTDIESEYKRIDISLFLESAVNIKTFRFEFGTSKNVGNGKLNNRAIIYAKNAKLEIGDKATPFYPRSFGEELALCKRYFRRIRQSESAIGTSIIIGMGKVASISSKQVIIIVPGETEMRIAPSVTWNGKLNITFDDKTVSNATVGQALIIGSSLLLRLTSASTPSHTHLFAYADLNSLDGKNVGYMDFDSEIY